MRIQLLATVAAGGLILASCGGGSDGVQSDVADDVIAAIGDEGIDADEGCIRDLAGQLSDDDAQAILDAGPDGDADVSADGEALGLQMLDCVDISSMIDPLIDDMIAEMGDENVDADCMRDMLSDLSAAQLESGEFIGDVLQCVELGG